MDCFETPTAKKCRRLPSDCLRAFRRKLSFQTHTVENHPRRIACLVDLMSAGIDKHWYSQNYTLGDRVCSAMRDHQVGMLEHLELRDRLEYCNVLGTRVELCQIEIGPDRNDLDSTLLRAPP